MADSIRSGTDKKGRERKNLGTSTRHDTNNAGVIARHRSYDKHGRGNFVQFLSIPVNTEAINIAMTRDNTTGGPIFRYFSFHIGAVPSFNQPT